MRNRQFQIVLRSTLLAMLVGQLFVSVLAQNLERIPLVSKRQPSNDLIFEGRTLTAEEAFRLSNSAENPIDLSQLDPAPSTVWTNTMQSVLDRNLDKIPLNEDEVFEFKGTITSNQGLIRFNVLPEDKSRVFTILMEKTLHTTLLRKNLLRKLGYTVPAMRYLKNIKVSFESIAERDRFLNNEVPEATYGAPSRWLGFDHRDLSDDQLTITLNDVVAFMPSETDSYNPAMGVPPRRLTSRTLRSLVVPYAVMDVGESINKLPWTVGTIDNETLVLPHFTFANMNATYDDVLWSLRRLALLDRKDFEEIVELSFFPKPVATLITEKLISRRNALLEIVATLGDIKAESIAVETKVSQGEELKKGTLTVEDWPGFASRFAHGEPDSPFKDFQYFVFSKLQNETLQALLGRANEELSLFDPSEKKLEFIQDQFEEGLEHFIDTGEFKEFGVGTWFSPIVNGNLILSRDIIVGNYLGTDNMVQLADTIGLSLTLGGILGIENIPQWPSASATATVNAVRTYTHLKPVKTLKASFKEPYQNMIVPLMKKKLRQKLDELANIPNSSEDGTDVDEDEVDPRLKAIEDILEEINGQLGVGESLLITDRLTPNALVRGAFSMMETRFSLSGGASGTLLKRLHLYRKDASTIHVYEDRGRGLTLSMSAGVDHLIPVLRLSLDRTNGKYKVKMHSVNINTDLSENPELFYQAKALHHLLEEGSSELLEVKTKPYQIEGDFVDRSVKMSFLVWRSKYLNGDNEITVTTPQESRSEYVSLTSQSQSGINYQAFAYDVLNYYLKEWTADLPITPQLNPERFKNPGQSIFGVSETVGARFEARKREEKLEIPFLSLSSKREGWSASAKRLKKYMRQVNDHYGRALFDQRSIDNASGLQLFEISVNTNVYEQGIERLKNVSEKTISNIGRRYARERSSYCGASERRNFNIRGPRQFRECGNLNTMKRKAKECQRIRRQEGDSKRQAKCTMELAKKMMRDLEFNDFLEVVGIENVFVKGFINGFRRDSEILNDPIPSNSIGRVRSRFWNGPLERVKEIMGIQGGEFHGKWIRESL